jgi:hypothetical protein
MEENNSPYVYEKPLRPRVAKRVRAFATVGLFAVGTAIGGSAFGSVLATSQEPQAETADNANANVVVVDPATASATDAFGNVAAAVDPVPAEPIVQVPLQQAKPNPGERALSLPVLPDQNFSNLSSATPSAGSGSQGAGSYSYGEREARVGHDDEDDDDDRYESDHRGDGDDYEDGDDD